MGKGHLYWIMAGLLLTFQRIFLSFIIGVINFSSPNIASYTLIKKYWLFKRAHHVFCVDEAIPRNTQCLFLYYAYIHKKLIENGVSKVSCKVMCMRRLYERRIVKNRYKNPETNTKYKCFCGQKQNMVEPHQAAKLFTDSSFPNHLL